VAKLVATSVQSSCDASKIKAYLYKLLIHINEQVALKSRIQKHVKKFILMVLN